MKAELQALTAKAKKIIADKEAEAQKLRDEAEKTKKAREEHQYAEKLSKMIDVLVERLKKHAGYGEDSLKLVVTGDERLANDLVKEFKDLDPVLTSEDVRQMDEQNTWFEKRYSIEFNWA